VNAQRRASDILDPPRKASPRSGRGSGREASRGGQGPPGPRAPDARKASPPKAAGGAVAKRVADGQGARRSRSEPAEGGGGSGREASRRRPRCPARAKRARRRRRGERSRSEPRGAKAPLVTIIMMMAVVPRTPRVIMMRVFCVDPHPAAGGRERHTSSERYFDETDHGNTAFPCSPFNRRANAFVSRVHAVHRGAFADLSVA
jgi:hypothetical protein